jgi:hypothetical protein
VPHAVFRVPTKWGAAIYYTNLEIVTVVEKIKPAFTGRELLHALAALGYRHINRMRLIQWLGVLRRLNIISLSEIKRS